MLVSETHKPVFDAVIPMVKAVIFNGGSGCPTPWPEDHVAFMNNVILSKWTEAQNNLGQADGSASSKIRVDPKRGEARMVSNPSLRERHVN